MCKEQGVVHGNGCAGIRIVTSAEPQVHALGCGVCINCGYDLRGSRPQQCPECGFDLPPGAIDLLVATHERVLFSRLFLGMAVCLYCLVVAPALYFGGTSLFAITLGPLLLMAVAVLLRYVFSRAFLGAVAVGRQDAVRFTDAGMYCRNLGTWSSLMPYGELDAFVLRRCTFAESWRFRVTFRMFGISFSFAKGWVSLEDQAASRLREEISGRIARAKRSQAS